ncbi:MAP3K3 [Symbiodinium natans]|uniref:MAP3K3 protein n=1 Tax=Symbiodinium natans TaxID=878477 RepID=A0A812LKZ1_9DINO|nr:MAP3K3 [Symbiodinium natans]
MLMDISSFTISMLLHCISSRSCGCFLLCRLQRMVELVRINLVFRGDDGHQRELRIMSEVMAGGGIRTRNQPLAVTMRNVENGDWQRAVERCFATKFGLSPTVQKSCFNMAKDAYNYQENSATSESTPGILTKYKTHSIKMTVKDRTRHELQQIGLPDGAPFVTNAEGVQHWVWTRVTNNKEEELINKLQKYGVCLDEFTWQSFVELYDEVYEKQQSQLEPVGDELVRYVRIVKIWLWANVLNCRHTLVLRTKQQHSRTHVLTSPRVLSMRMAEDQTWQEAVVEALTGRLGINEALQRSGLHVSEAAFRQEVEFSPSFPGLKTHYGINEVHVEVLNPQDQRWNSIGLPAGVEFTFVRQESRGGETDTIVSRWGWTNSHELDAEHAFVKRKSLFPSWKDSMKRRKHKSIQEQDKQVEIPEPLEIRGTHELVIARIMEGKTTDWARAKRAAEQIRSPSYTTREFHDDITAAFPELRLYCLISMDEDDITRSQSQTSSGSITTSGRSAFDEYQRTIGALFCVFWLMRQHLDGRECFSYGLNQDWLPRTQKDFTDDADSGHNDELQLEWQKRQAFYERTDWEAFENLIVAAGLLKKKGGPHDAERTLALLVLMVIHDLMKLDRLRPICSVKTFQGYKKGESIGDHDIALSYVLERHSSALPSFAGLPSEQQKSIRFTHCKLEYNMGWLVQAEAPPGALFRAFRRVIQSGLASDRDSSKEVAFYFIHWFADLAGAEPYPLQGCEKFVLKFPKHVLTSFVESFPVVWTLGPKTETQVYEDYLEWRWQNLPKLGPVPADATAIAKMRLVIMAQSDGSAIIRALSKLDREDMEIISEELSLTGLCDQSFSKVVGPKRGPALLLYYAPAMMQKAGREDALNTLRILAELLRRARQLWPMSNSKDSADATVIIRIDALKDSLASEIVDVRRRRYALIKTSQKDGQVRQIADKDPPADGIVLDFNWNSPARVQRNSLMMKSRTSIPMFASTFSNKHLSNSFK